MPIHVTFTGETHEHVLAEINTFLAVTAIPVSVQTADKEEKPKSRRGRPKKEATGEAPPPPSRRRRSTSTTKKEDKFSPEMKDALKVAHQVSEDINEGDDLVKEVLKEEFQKDNLSDLTDKQLKELTEILTAELNAPDPAED